MRIIHILLLLSNLGLLAQDFNKGYTYLEQGDWNKATVFFEEALAEYPNNKTAKLCYGRAIGLSGRTNNAAAIFEALLEEYPNDFEIQLNYAESMLWRKEFEAAKIYYIFLVEKNPTSFPALLGMANTYANLKSYSDALVFIEEALGIEPENNGAAISKKYIRLGYAAQLSKKHDYEPAIDQLQRILESYPGDTEASNLLAEIYTQQEELSLAQLTYSTLKDSVAKYRGLSLIAHKMHHNKDAVRLAKLGVETVQADNQKNKLLAFERYIQALIWNRNYKKAKVVIEMIAVEFPENVTVYALQATLGMYTARFSESLVAYKKILAIDSTSFDGNLGIASAYRAKGNVDLAETYAKTALQYYAGQQDIQEFLAMLQNEMQPRVSARGITTLDNGNNKAWAYGLYAVIPFTNRFEASFDYGYRITENDQSNTMAKNSKIRLGAVYRFLNNVTINAALGVTKAKANNTIYTQANGGVVISARPLPNQFISVGYNRQLQDFNASLIEEEIFMNHYNLSYNMGTHFGLGWYNAYTYTNQTDGNSRNLLFTSLYHQIFKRPIVKAGVNYQIMSFKDQVPELYFSPNKYQSLEIFAELSGTYKKLGYTASAAAGKQVVASGSATALYRMEMKGDYGFGENFKMSAYAKYSNIASETAAGFSFTEIGLQLHWKLHTKKKINGTIKNE